MPDPKAGGWRKRLHAPEKRSKTPLQTVSAKDIVTGELHDERAKRDRSISQQGESIARKSRPQTPAIAVTPTCTDLTDESRGMSVEIGSEVVSPRRKSAPMPRLKRMFSDMFPLKTDEKNQNVFSEYWSDDFFLPIEMPIDPMVVVQQVRSHIASQSWLPLSVEHNNGLLRVFEDYRKAIEQKDEVYERYQTMLEGYRRAEQVWRSKEEKYQEEVRRLELMIARGTTGLSGVIQAKQGTVIDRKRRHRHESNTSEMALENMTPAQLDEQIKLRSQRVMCQRSSSPSRSMVMLSQRLGGGPSEATLPVGTPPYQTSRGTLSRKVKSEMDFTTIGDATLTDEVTRLMEPGFSSPGDHLPDELTDSANIAMDLGIESEAFVALRELAGLVARRQGVDTERFMSRLLSLYSSTSQADGNEEANLIQDISSVHTKGDLNMSKGRARTRRYQAAKQKRHFSFEPGDDRFDELSQKLTKLGYTRSRSPAGSQSTRSSDLDVVSANTAANSGSFTSTMLKTDLAKPTKIPSPVQAGTRGHLRRDESVSSNQSISRRDPHDDRRESRTSVQTAFRTASTTTLARPNLSSRSNSANDALYREGSVTKSRAGNLKSRTSMATIAALRAVEGNSPVRDGQNTRTVRSARAQAVSQEGPISQTDAAP